MTNAKTLNWVDHKNVPAMIAALAALAAENGLSPDEIGLQAEELNAARDAINDHAALIDALNNSIETLQTGASTETAERQAAITTLTTSLASAVAALEAADTALQQGLDDNAAADAAEAQARAAGDATLAQAVTAETAAREAAETALQEAIDSKASQDDLESETAAREAVAERVGVTESQISAERVKEIWRPVVSELLNRSNTSTAADPDDPSYSPWFEISGGVLYASESHKAYVHCDRSRAARPGHYEDPRYSTLWSELRPEFVLSNIESRGNTSESINARIDELGIEVTTRTGWNTAPYSWEIPVIFVPDTHIYMRLWMRWNNALHAFAPEGADRQSIVDYGDDRSEVIINRVEVYDV